MTDFYFPTRFDEALADEGVWTPEIKDELEQSYGKFKVCLLDETTDRYRVTKEKLERKYPQTKSGKPNPLIAAMTQMEFAVEILVEMSIVDWEMKNGKGEPVPFTKAACKSYLNHPKAQPVFVALSEFVRDIFNFQPAEQTELPEGN